MRTLLSNIKLLCGIQPNDRLVLRGAELSDFPSIPNAYLLIEDEIIHSFGPMSEIDHSHADHEINCRDRMVLPAFVDSHTHLVFAYSREEEFVDKIRGLSYAEIAARGGGILNSAKKLRDMPEDELFERTLNRAVEIMKTGTGAVEIKSGYGLTLDAELKMLRVARRIGEETPLTVRTTLLGAHAIPREIKTRRDYIDQVIQEMIPAAAAEGLADYCDVFCEEGFFTESETDEILQQGLKYGLKPKVHANQLHRSGGVQSGIRNHALSVDHLEQMGKEELDLLDGSSTIATLLPGAAFFLAMNFPPARDILKRDTAVALASDFNPGSSPSGNMPLMVSLACIQMKMTPEEALNASTLNGAAAMEISDRLGSVTRGKIANLIVTKEVPSLAFLPYAYGSNWIEQVYINGKQQ